MKVIKFRDDTKAEIFKRYFNAFLSKLQRQKITLQASTTEIKKLASTIDEQQNKITEASQKVNQQNQALKLLIGKVKNRETEIESKNSFTVALTKTKEKLSAAIKQLESELNNKDNTIKTQGREIERLKNLKWYHKLVGQK